MPLNCLSLYWLAMEIWNARPQARVWPSLIVVGDPLPQDCSKMLLTQRDHVVQALTTDASYQPFTVGIWPSAPARVFAVLSARMLSAHRRLPSRKSHPDHESRIDRHGRWEPLLETAARSRQQSDEP
jgi:hypothetical protein